MTNNRYTIIDLGSNSFHMLTVERINNGFSVYSKSKQKVRLAAGLDEQYNINQETIQKGLDCLTNFKNELRILQPVKVLITATAALRLANNKEVFIKQAEEILQRPINLISGLQEARIIYKGVAFTENILFPLLVIDIGGASTELIIGEGTTVKIAHSLDMGCVTWLKRYFPDNQLNQENFKNAIEQAKKVIQPEAQQYLQQGWSLTMGASGTIQAVQEINEKQKLSPEINLQLLYQIRALCIRCGTIENLHIDGLKLSRKLVFASGLSILIALFEILAIPAVQCSKGALREGLISILFSSHTETTLSI
ncbi:Ppx/GppA phosphatase [Psychromonas ingrahamii 37]|uniref:Ppx/GppA phosphatase n=1 Tax=Psychromonas ingrahamii (strain DSM 17664 / CCUG 51855 / 37) TaxID=357804 RepID=A1SZG5_PSYIN|nr:guanosine-5'-triphosphate,3'-diphosphate pyrophosphatase [Psychromonas ingrahamii]ABM04880.1 Ppx/GppA phosphatase [Psychromonas ingrahamii 37]